jgi:hypothetical protein
MKLFKKISLIGIVFLLVGCFLTETKNAEKAYKYWSGNQPPKEIELIKGEYYQSPHFIREYELFLKFKSYKTWFDEFIEYNGLQVDTVGNELQGWTKLPEWFKPNQNYLIYAKDQTDKFGRSRYLRNPKTGISYIYETLGM